LGAGEIEQETPPQESEEASGQRCYLWRGHADQYALFEIECKGNVGGKGSKTF